MAKKKLSHNNHRQEDNNLKNPIQPQTNMSQNDDVSYEKLEHLKSLNSLLLKEATERRQQVDSLKEAKGSLEMVLNRTESVKVEMMSELAHLGEESLVLELEKMVCLVFVGFQIGEFCEGVVKVRGEVEALEKERSELLEGMRVIEMAKSEKDGEVLVLEEKIEVLEKDKRGIEKAKIEKDGEVLVLERKIEVLEKEMSEVLLEKREVEEAKSKKDGEVLGLVEKIVVLEKERSGLLQEKRVIEEEKNGEVLVLEEKVKGLLNEIGLEKGVCEEMKRERDELEAKLGVKIEEAEDLSMKLIDMERKFKGVKEEIEKLGKKHDFVVEENEERKNEIEELMREKSRVESDNAKVIKEMEGKIVSIEKEKQGVEEELSLEKAKKVELESTVSRTVSNLDRVEEKLRVAMAELEKKRVEGADKQKEMALEIEKLVGEKNEMSKGLERVVEEKNLVEKNLDDALKQLDDQKMATEMVENEKIKVLEALSEKESAISDLQKEASEFKEVVKQLLSACNEGTVEIKNLESEVGRYKDALDKVELERDEGRKVIDEEKTKGLELLRKIEDMAKIIEEKAKLVEDMKAEKAGISDEKGELENICGKLRNDLALAESSLAKVRKEFDTFRNKVELEEESSMKVLNMLKGTAAELVSSIVDEKIGTDGEKKLNGGSSEPYISELEMIKNAFKRNEIKGEEMKRQIESLQNSVAEEHKKKNFWTLLSSATTILATISLAYIARGH
ncbi:hypothetical protein Leryth_001515 [Lithospermum erythrorhizon]|nr:hypothetical protein Leryth_001515 [Lithospermum erythrorhizon]